MQQPSRNGMSTGAKIGIGLIVTAVLVGAGVGVYYVLQRRKTAQANAALPTTTPTSDVSDDKDVQKALADAHKETTGMTALTKATPSAPADSTQQSQAAADVTPEHGTTTPASPISQAWAGLTSGAVSTPPSPSSSGDDSTAMPFSALTPGKPIAAPSPPMKTVTMPFTSLTPGTAAKPAAPVSGPALPPPPPPTPSAPVAPPTPVLSPEERLQQARAKGWLVAGDTLTPDRPLISPNGRFKLIQMPKQGLGMLVLRDTVADKNIWRSTPVVLNARFIVMSPSIYTVQERDGNLLTRFTPNPSIPAAVSGANIYPLVWQSGVHSGSNPNTYTAVQNDGNIVTFGFQEILGAGKTTLKPKIIWQSNTAQPGLSQPAPITLPPRCDPNCVLWQGFVHTDRHLLPNANWPYYNSYCDY